MATIDKSVVSEEDRDDCIEQEENEGTRKSSGRPKSDKKNKTRKKSSGCLSIFSSKANKKEEKEDQANYLKQLQEENVELKRKEKETTRHNKELEDKIIELEKQLSDVSIISYVTSYTAHVLHCML